MYAGEVFCVIVSRSDGLRLIERKNDEHYSLKINIMICSDCKNINRPDSKFCRSCGVSLNRINEQTIVTIPSFNGVVRFFRQQNKKVVLVLALVVLLGATTVFAAPRVKDFIDVNRAIQEAITQEASGGYQDALNTLMLADDKWTTASKRQEIAKLKETQTRYAKFKTSFILALEKEKEGKLIEAREQLQSIGVQYPQYDVVREKLNALQVSIEGSLEEKAHLKEVEAQKANAVATEARHQAALDSAAKTRAESEKASSDAQVLAATQFARDAELQRQQEAAKRAKEVEMSFKNQLIIGNNSYISGVSYYSSAVSYSNSGSSVLAISQANSARALLSTARNNISNLNSRFTGMSSDYYAAANNLVIAIDYLTAAMDLLVQTEGTSVDYSSTINSNKNLAAIYASKVQSFINSN